MCQDSSYNFEELPKGKKYLAALQKKTKYE